MMVRRARAVASRRLTLQRQRDVGQRPDGHQVDRTRSIEHGAHQEINGMLVGERQFGVVRVEQAHALMPGPVHRPLAEQRFAHTQPNRHIGLAGERQELVHHARAQRHIPVHAGDANGLQLRRPEQQRESQAVVDVSPDVGVEQDGQRHGAEQHSTAQRRTPLSRALLTRA